MAELSDIVDAIVAIIILIAFAPVINSLAGQLGGDFAQLIRAAYSIGFIALIVGLILIITSVVEDLF